MNKKIIILFFIIVSVIIVFTKNISNAATITLKDYLYGKGDTTDTFYKKEKDLSNKELHEYLNDNDVSKSNQKKCDAIAKDNVGEIRFGVRYNWLHATQNLITKINSDNVKYTIIANDNNTTDIENTIKALKHVRTQLGTFIGDETDITDGKVSFWHVYLNDNWMIDWDENQGYDNSETLADPIRSAQAFENITKINVIGGIQINAKLFKEKETVRAIYLNGLKKYDQKICAAIQELNAAYDYKKGNGSCESANIYIDDNYKTKFLYSLSDIKFYDRYYSIGRLGTKLDDTEKNLIKKCWGAKAAAEAAGYPTVATRTDEGLYVKKGHDYVTKMMYDIDQIWLYLQMYGVSFGYSGLQEGTTAIEWANMLKGKGHTQFYGKHIDGATQKFNGEYNAGYTATEVANAIAYLRGIENVVDEGLQSIRDATDIAEKTTSNYEQDANNSSSAASADEEARNGEGEHKEDPDKDTAFRQPARVSEKNEDGSEKIVDTVSDAINDAETFVTNGNSKGIISTDNLQEFSQNLYSTLLAIGVVVSVIIGVIIGVKLMLAPIQERAEAKKLLIPYTVGCVIVFGAFGIWKLIVTIMQGM